VEGRQQRAAGLGIDRQLFEQLRLLLLVGLEPAQARTQPYQRCRLDGRPVCCWKPSASSGPDTARTAIASPLEISTDSAPGGRAFRQVAQAARKPVMSVLRPCSRGRPAAPPAPGLAIAAHGQGLIRVPAARRRRTHGGGQNQHSRVRSRCDGSGASSGPEGRPWPRKQARPGCCR